MDIENENETSSYEEIDIDQEEVDEEKVSQFHEEKTKKRVKKDKDR